MTQEEKDFIVSVMGTLKIDPTKPDATKIVELVQSIIKQLSSAEEQQ